MTISKYFNWTERGTEQDLYEDLTVEHIQMFGYEIYYLPRNVITMDVILGEDIQTVFDRVYKIEALLPDAGNFGGDQTIMSKFGLRIDETSEFMISKKRFYELGIPNYVRPREGDLIWMGNPDEPNQSFPNVVFEINQVWYDWPGFQFGKQYVYKMVAQTFTWSWERFRTGNKTIDYVAHVEGGPADAQDPGSLNVPLITEAAALMDSTTGNPFGNF